MFGFRVCLRGVPQGRRKSDLSKLNISCEATDDSSVRPSAEGATLYQPRPLPNLLLRRKSGVGLGWYSVAPSALGLAEESAIGVLSTYPNLISQIQFHPHLDQ